jgi:hypothetical protein
MALSPATTIIMKNAPHILHCSIEGKCQRSLADLIVVMVGLFPSHDPNHALC